MPRVTQRTARKDYPEYDIKKGDMYYTWAFRYGGVRKSKTRPRPSQLTSSKMSGVYAAREAMEDAVAAFRGERCLDTLKSEIESAIEDARSVAQEYRDSADSIRDTFPESTTADECEEKADSIEEWCDNVESVKDALDDQPEQEGEEEPDEEGEPDTTVFSAQLEEWADNVVGEMESAIGDLSV